MTSNHLSHASKHEYRPEIDGLRALSVFAVVLFHADAGGVGGGYVGVDVFFVISGYLITSIILNQINSGGFTLLDFYERRARRIIPVLMFVMLTSIPFAALLLLPGDLVSYGRSLIAVSTFTSNFLFWSERGYFGTATELKPLVHTWSLSVEEQFYLLFPLFLVACSHVKRTWRGLSIMTILLASLWSSWFLTRLHFETAFYLPFARAWELMFGAAAAFYRPRLFGVAEKFPSAVSLLGLSMIIFSIISFDEETSFPGVAALVPVMGAFLYIVASPKDNIVASIMSHRLIVGLGLISFSLYLWHQPIFSFLRHYGAPEYYTLIAIPASILLSVLSYRYVETPFRDRNKVSARSIFIVTFSSSIFMICAGLFFVKSDGLLARYSIGDRKVLSQFAESADYNQTRFDELVLKPFHEGSKVKVVVVGDSYAKDIINVMYEGGANEFIQFSTKQINSECGNVLGEVNFEQLVPENRFLRCEFMGRYEDDSFSEILSDADEIWLISSWYEWVVELLPATISNLSDKYEAHIRVFESKTVGEITMTSALAVNQNERSIYSQPTGVEVLAINERLGELVPENNLVRLQSVLCQESGLRCRIFTPSGELVSTDGGHLTAAGARHFAPSVINELRLSGLGSRYGVDRAKIIPVE